MNNKFKVGDIIVFRYEQSIYCNEVGMEQLVTFIDNNYHTEFLDSNKKNYFAVDSNYPTKCDFIRNIGLIYKNGVPMLWDDVI